MLFLPVLDPWLILLCSLIGVAICIPKGINPALAALAAILLGPLCFLMIFVSSEVKTCPQCAEKVRKGAKACMHCGNKFADMAAKEHPRLRRSNNARANWYYRQNGVEGGPIVPAELLRMAKAGLITPATEVKKENSKWMAASNISQLFTADNRTHQAARPYQWEGMDQTGEPRKGVIEAHSPDEAIAKIKNQGFWPTRVGSGGGDDASA